VNGQGGEIGENKTKLVENKNQKINFLIKKAKNKEKCARK